MNTIENKLSEILSRNGDIAAVILQTCEELHSADKVSLNSQLQEELMKRLTENSLEEEVWDSLLWIMAPSELSETVFDHLVQNNVSTITLCHMKLQDKLLMKLVSFDEAPLYTLAERYYLSDGYSAIDFSELFNQYLRHSSDVCIHLLDTYGNISKRGLLISLCSNNENFEYKEMLQWHLMADQVRNLTDSKVIEEIYRKHQSIGTVLIEIAKNPFIPEDILLNLASVKGVKYASEIR